MASSELHAPLLASSPPPPRGARRASARNASSSPRDDDASSRDVVAPPPVTDASLGRARAGAGLETLDYEPVHNAVARREARRRFAELIRGGPGRGASSTAAESEPESSASRRRRSFYGYTGATLVKSVLCVVVGVVVGALAFSIDAAVNEIYALKQWLILERFEPSLDAAAAAAAAVRDAPRWPPFAFAGTCLGLVLVASSLCVFWAPQAAGGGVTLVMAYLNGTNVPGVLEWRALVAKTLGVVCAVGSSLAVGPEGPMVHVGAAVAAGVTLAAPKMCLPEVTGTGGGTGNGGDGEEDEEEGGGGGGGEGVLDAEGFANGDAEGFANGDASAASTRSRSVRDGRRRFPSSLNPSSPFPWWERRRRSFADSFSARVGSRRRFRSVLFDLASDATQREFVSAGAAAGLAAAFGAPIGGVLFSLEEASTHWSRRVMWRSFICAAAASLTLAMMESRGRAGMLFFGGVRPTTPRDFVHQTPFFVVAAACAGFSGVVFNHAGAVLAKMGVRPKPHRRVMRVLECALVSILTIVARFAASRFLGRCVSRPAAWAADEEFGVRFLCRDPGAINDVATLFFSSPNRAIGWMLSMGTEAQPWGAASYGFTAGGLSGAWFAYLLMMIAAYGTAVPGGIFMPSIFSGACLGGALGLAFKAALPATWDVQPGVYALIGATATLGGVFRSSISLVVIMVEGTGGGAFVFVVILAVVVSNFVSGWFQAHGVYHADLGRNKETMAFVQGEPPAEFAALTARDIMAGDGAPTCVRAKEAIGEVRRVLAATTHNGFPVTDARGRLVGLALRSQLAVMVEGGRMAAPGAPREAKEALDAYMRVAHLRGAGDRVVGSRPWETTTTRRDDDGMSPGGTRSRSGSRGDSGSDFDLELDDPLEDEPPLEDAEEASASGGVTRGQTREEGSDGDSGVELDVAAFMHASPPAVREGCPAARVHAAFARLGARHVVVTDAGNRVVGVVTRKDVTRWRRRVGENADERR